MSPEVALLQETWEIVKSNVNAKDRLGVADALLRAFDEHVDISEIHEYKNEFDKVMKAAMVDYFEEELDEDDDNYSSEW